MEESFWEFFALSTNLVYIFHGFVLQMVLYLCFHAPVLILELSSFHSKCCSWRCLWASNCGRFILRYLFRSICDSWRECCVNWRTGMIFSCLIDYSCVFGNMDIASFSLFCRTWRERSFLPIWFVFQLQRSEGYSHTCLLDIISVSSFNACQFTYVVPLHLCFALLFTFLLLDAVTCAYELADFDLARASVPLLPRHFAHAKCLDFLKFSASKPPGKTGEELRIYNTFIWNHINISVLHVKY